MQNLIAARPSSSSIVATHSFAAGSFPGCQLKQHDHPQFGLPSSVSIGGRRSATFVVTAFFGGSKTPPIKSAGKGCLNCLGKGAVDCAGCKGTGRNKKNGNMFERWKCYDCQGFGMVGCPNCGTGGLTPEQRRER